MVIEGSKPLTAASETDERMRRVRVGVTGLAAVLLVVALATVIMNMISQRATANATTPPTMVASIGPPSNGSVGATEPLAELGVAPDAKDAVAKR